MAADNAFSFANIASPKGRQLEQMVADVSASYKYYWLLSLVKIVSEGKTGFISNQEMAARMIAAAWYPVVYFRLKFGYSDKLEEKIRLVQKECALSDDASYEEIIEAILQSRNSELKSKLSKLTRYVPSRFIGSLFDDQLAISKRQYGSSFEGHKDNDVKIFSQEAGNKSQAPYVIEKGGITLMPDWIQFFLDYSQMITDSTYFKLTQFVQRRNPNVPAVSEKLIRPTERKETEEFKSARNYWKRAIKSNEQVYDIYTKNPFTENALNRLGGLAIDHFVPWRFVLHDRLWNLVPTFGRPNSSKSDNLPDRDFLDDFCNIQILGLKANIDWEKPENIEKNKKKKKADPIMDAYRDLMPNAKSIADLLKHEAQLREKLQDAVGALLLQAKIQGFSKWQSDYVSGNDLRL